MENRVLVPALCLSLSLGLLAGCEREEPAVVEPVEPVVVEPAPTVTPTDPIVTTTPATPDVDVDVPPPTELGTDVYNATGTITVVDPTASQVTVDHEAVAALNWPAMTMTFDVEQPTLLENLETGDEVSFAFVQAGENRYVIQQITEEAGNAQAQQEE